MKGRREECGVNGKEGGGEEEGREVNRRKERGGLEGRVKRRERTNS